MTIPPESLPDGAYNITFRSTDILGNQATETRAASIDREAPELDLTATLSVGNDDDRPLPQGIDGYLNAQQAAQLVAQASDQASGVRTVKIDELTGGLDPALLADEDEDEETPDSAFDPVRNLLASINRPCVLGTCAPAETLPATVATLSEGLHRYAATASDAIGNTTDEALNLLVDKTPPPPPVEEDFAIATSDPLTGAATVVWRDNLDPDLPDGQPGSGLDFDEARFRIGLLGAWSDWQAPLDTPQFSVAGVGAGLLPIDVQVRSVDAAGNRSTSVEKRFPTSTPTQGGLTGDLDRLCTTTPLAQPDQQGVLEQVRRRRPDGTTFFEIKQYPEVVIHGRAVVNCNTSTRILKVSLDVCLKMKQRNGSRFRSQVCDHTEMKPVDDGRDRLSMLLDIPCRSGDRTYQITTQTIVTIPQSSIPGPAGILDIGRQRDVRLRPSLTKEWQCPAAETWRYKATHRWRGRKRVADPGSTRAQRREQMTRLNPGTYLGRVLTANGQPRPHVPASLESGKAAWAAHHMVAASDAKSDLPQGYAFVCSLDANQFSNGVWLRMSGLKSDTQAFQDLRPIELRDRAYHPGIHTMRYYREVATRLRYTLFRSEEGDLIDFHGGGVNGGGSQPPTCNKQDAAARLRKRIRPKLENNTFPYKENGMDDNDPLDPDD